MARPRKDDTDTRLTARITALLTPADRAALEQAAAEMSMTPSSFARVWIMKGIQATEATRAGLTAQRAIDQKLFDRLEKYGQRLNNLAHRANETQDISDERAIEAISNLLVGVIDRVEALPKGHGHVSVERRNLMNEITRVGNNAMQLKHIAGLRDRTKTVAILDGVEDRIVACVERMIST